MYNAEHLTNMSSSPELKDELTKCLESSMTKFNKIWAEIGICESQQKQRSDTVIIHLRNLLEEMLQEEEALRNQIRNRIEKYRTEVQELCADLSVPDYKQKKAGALLQVRLYHMLYPVGYTCTTLTVYTVDKFTMVLEWS